MKITRVEICEIKMPLLLPYTISYETVDSVSNVFIRIDTDKEISGNGCAAPDKIITNETSNSVLRCLKDRAEAILLKCDPLRPVHILEELREPLSDCPSAKAAIDMALYDIMGKYANLPLWKLLGGYREKIKTSITIGIQPIKDTLKLAKEYLLRGFTILKLKGGRNVDEDIERVNELRKFAGKGIELRFDANQGYSVEDTFKFIKATRKAHIE
jgi:L-alanine-DL-glutamate epimerase-like enolase superfamily enzyme